MRVVPFAASLSVARVSQPHIQYVDSLIISTSIADVSKEPPVRGSQMWRIMPCPSSTMWSSSALKRTKRSTCHHVCSQ